MELGFVILTIFQLDSEIVFSAFRDSAFHVSAIVPFSIPDADSLANADGCIDFVLDLLQSLVVLLAQNFWIGHMSDFSHLLIVWSSRASSRCQLQYKMLVSPLTGSSGDGGIIGSVFPALQVLKN